MRLCNCKVLLALAIVAGLLLGPAAFADSIPDLSSLLNANPGLLEPFSGMPAGDFSSPEAIALANYWFDIISDPWDNYSLIVELFGADAAATMLAAETPAQLLNPPTNPPSITGTDGMGMNGTGEAADQASVPEPGTVWPCGAGLLALLGRGLISRRSRGRRVPV